tara:strand:- start:2 stop:235 length:234 start_codon:yes stop_codon:yes gene_type:complete
MSRWRTEKSNHPISKLLLNKGYDKFEYGGSQFQNEYSGWWLESEKHKELNGKFLGCTLKESIWNLKNTNDIPDISIK